MHNNLYSLELRNKEMGESSQEKKDMGDQVGTANPSQASPEKEENDHSHCCGCCVQKNSGNGEGSSSFTPEQLRASQVERYLKTFPVGLTFQPTDKEAVLFFLTKRDRNDPLPSNPIQEVNMYKSTPEDLLDKYREHMVRGELYVFTSRDKKYDNGSRPKRYITGRYVGYWKISGQAKEIIKKHGTHVGTRRTLDFYKVTEGKGKRDLITAFKMHEYLLDAENNVKSVQGGGKKQKKKLKPVNLALCKIWKKTKKISSPVPESPSRNTDTALLGHANISSPVQEPLSENTDTALLGHVNPETNSLVPDVTGEYLGSSLSSNMDMAFDDANFSGSSGFSPDMFTTTLFDNTFENFMDIGDNYSWGEEQTEELQVPLKQENQLKSSGMSDYLPGLDISDLYNFGFGYPDL